MVHTFLNSYSFAQKIPPDLLFTKAGNSIDMASTIAARHEAGFERVRHQLVSDTETRETPIERAAETQAQQASKSAKQDARRKRQRQKNPGTELLETCGEMNLCGGKLDENIIIIIRFIH
ncbi:hypothetical protein K3495_g4997 [Podosphaera aphanis]|nr:hypothetical protein K3495_g4997 [Podosphaera aphanis]